ncbi:hypothetical protein ACTTAI_05745 [Rhodobacter capsulatus]|uniref:hypothetical protein n=1 Tax=Rhodobacter capsulatus TaxID=1061 RepID=UPI00402A0065
MALAQTTGIEPVFTDLQSGARLRSARRFIELGEPETSLRDSRNGLNKNSAISQKNNSLASRRFVHIEDVSGSNPLSPTIIPQRP